MNGGRRTALALAGRSLMLIPRIPSTFVPSVAMPVFFTISFSGAFSAIANLPGFPTDQMLEWIAPMSLLQGAAFAGITTGMGIATDVEHGFYERVLLAPQPRWAILAGPLLASAARSIVPIVLVLAVALVGGARFESVLAGPLVLALAAVLTAMLAGAWSLGLAYRFRSTNAAPVMQVGLFLTFFLSTAQVPLAVLTGWLHAVARVNPMTNVLRAARQGMIGEVTWHDTWPGLLALLAGLALLTMWARRGLDGMTR